MNFDELLSAELPDPRDDEPEHLRRDILDELSDHLSCSYRKELLAGADAESAYLRALERFGNPAAIAARLWLDAMKGKIMSQRLLITTCVLLLILCLGLVGFSAFQYDRMSRVQARMLAASETSQKAMLQQMEAIAKAIEKPKSPDWNPASFKLTEADEKGTPVSGANVSFGKQGVNQSRIHRTSDKNGVVDLDAVQPGEYEYSITRRSSWSQGFWSTSGTVPVKPYKDLFKSVICPCDTPRRGPVKIRCEWPSDFPRKGLMVHASFRGLAQAMPDGSEWSLTGYESDDDLRPKDGSQQQHIPFPRLDFLFDLETGRVARIRRTAPVYCTDKSPVLEIDPRNSSRPPYLGHLFAMVNNPDLIPVDDSTTVLEGSHRLHHVAILRTGRPPISSDIKDIELVAFGGPGSDTSNLNSVSTEWLPKLEGRELRLVGVGWANVMVPQRYMPAASGEFLAENGKVNTWVIKPAAELIERAREVLKIEEATKANQPGS